MAKFGIDIDEVLRSLLPGMVEIYNNRFHDSLTVDDIKEFDRNGTIYYIARLAFED